VLFGVLFCGYGEGRSAQALAFWIACEQFADTRCAGTLTFRLQLAQLAGTYYSFGAPLGLEFAKDVPIVSFHRVQGEEQPLANLLIRESLSNEVEDFHLAVAQ
jgi:hypothetical protein